MMMLRLMLMLVLMLLLVSMVTVGNHCVNEDFFCREASDESGEGSALCGLGEVKMFKMFKKLKSSDTSRVALVPAEK